jgi:hypothetical protein
MASQITGRMSYNIGALGRKIPASLCNKSLEWALSTIRGRVSWGYIRRYVWTSFFGQVVTVTQALVQVMPQRSLVLRGLLQYCQLSGVHESGHPGFP